MAENWIDVSAHQGVINWPKVAASGVKGAVIRAGYGNDPSQQDRQFAANIRGAASAGLKAAIYWFSYADSVDDALKEWAVCKQIIAPYKGQIKFVASDYEYDSYNYYKRVHGKAPDKALINQMACAFLAAARSDGWKTCLYTNNDYRCNVFTAATLKAADYLWLAWYTNATPASTDRSALCDMWQYASDGQISGIAGHPVDLNVSYRDFGAQQTSVQIDTTMDVTIPRGGYYTFKTVSSQQPTVTIGTPGVVQLMHCRREMEADYWHLCAVGEPGSEAGVYTAAPGEQPLKRFVVKIK